MADPKNPNQNGAVMPNSRASRPPIGVPMTMPADHPDGVDAGHAAQQLVGDRALADHRGSRAPHECMRTEDDHRDERDRG